MITRKRKPKPAYSRDRPTERLRLKAVTIEYKLPTRAAQPQQVARQLVLRSLRQGKVTVH